MNTILSYQIAEVLKRRRFYNVPIHEDTKSDLQKNNLFSLFLQNLPRHRVLVFSWDYLISNDKLMALPLRGEGKAAGKYSSNFARSSFDAENS